MRLINLGPNQIELKLQGRRFIRILFSYDTPVAAEIDNKFYRTGTKYSRTTERHIDNWIKDESCEREPQEFFDRLVTCIAIEEVIL